MEEVKFESPKTIHYCYTIDVDPEDSSIQELTESIKPMQAIAFFTKHNLRV